MVLASTLQYFSTPLVRIEAVRDLSILQMGWADCLSAKYDHPIFTTQP